eukprot:PLAT4393.3.p1 GENE.PLAT4393.3~~PLAT4393.3.p1  ORF type:complete len:520 (-),score=96.21 PLAT4393.3:189-1748(-)
MASRPPMLSRGSSMKQSSLRSDGSTRTLLGMNSRRMSLLVTSSMRRGRGSVFSRQPSPLPSKDASKETEGEVIASEVKAGLLSGLRSTRAAAAATAASAAATAASATSLSAVDGAVAAARGSRASASELPKAATSSTDSALLMSSLFSRSSRKEPRWKRPLADSGAATSLAREVLSRPALRLRGGRLSKVPSKRRASSRPASAPATRQRPLSAVSTTSMAPSLGGGRRNRRRVGRPPSARSSVSSAAPSTLPLSSRSSAVPTLATALAARQLPAVPSPRLLDAVAASGEGGSRVRSSRVMSFEEWRLSTSPKRASRTLSAVSDEQSGEVRVRSSLLVPPSRRTSHGSTGSASSQRRRSSAVDSKYGKRASATLQPPTAGAMAVSPSGSDRSSLLSIEESDSDSEGSDSDWKSPASSAAALRPYKRGARRRSTLHELDELLKSYSSSKDELTRTLKDVKRTSERVGRMARRSSRKLSETSQQLAGVVRNWHSSRDMKTKGAERWKAAVENVKELPAETTW